MKLAINKFVIFGSNFGKRVSKNNKFFELSIFKYKGRQLFWILIEPKNSAIAIRIFWLFTWFIEFKPRIKINFYNKLF